MPLADRYTEKARLTVDGKTFAVLVRVHEITDVRDGRIHEWGGTLWTDDAPPNVRPSRPYLNMEGEQATLTFADGTGEEIMLDSLLIWLGGTYVSTFSHVRHRHRWEQGDEN